MAKIKVNYDELNNQIELSGDVSKLLSNRFSLGYIRSCLTSEVDRNTDTIIVPVSGKPLEELLELVSSMLIKYEVEEERSASSKKVIVDFYKEEEKFKEFSVLAKKIRDNDCNAVEFQNFIDSIEINMKNRRLYGLQLLSAYHLAFSQNACNFSVPGAGKTSTVYGAYTYLKNLSNLDSKKVEKILIIGPLSSFGPWELEFIECFGYPPSSTRLVSSMKKQDKINYLHSRLTSEITLLSYASVDSLKDDLSYFLENNRVMVVLDEAHKIKNTSGGKIAQAVLDISKYASSRVVLTGTPAPNGYEDLHNLFKFIWPSKNILGFQINQLKVMSSTKNDLRVNHLIESITPFFIRIKKSDLGIPEAITHPPVIVEMGGYQRRIYDFIEKNYINSILENNEDDLSTQFKSQLVKAKMIRLMQAATNPSLLTSPLQEFYGFDGADSNRFVTIDDNDILKEIVEYKGKEVPTKFIEVKTLVKQILLKNEKVIIWASFIQNIFELKEYLQKNGIKCQELYGAIPVEKEGIEEQLESQEITREKIIKSFHNDNCPFQVIIANPFAVAESISLHKACNNAIYLERTFNAAHFIQSKDRIHRYGLDARDETNYYYILSKDSIDETIDERLALKEKRMIEIIETMPIPLFDNVDENIGRDDIKAMIKSYAKRIKRLR